ncbi:MAG: tetratricopeptide repeat protein [Myxococcota bacterium]
MSLVNDLLIETERRRRRTSTARTLRLDDLVPVRDDASRSRSASARLRGVAIGAVALLAIAVAAGLGARVAALRGPSFVGDLPALPAVAAPLAEAPASSDAKSATPRTEPIAAQEGGRALSAQRPTRIEAVLVDRVAGVTRVRVETDGPTRHRIEHDPASARLELVLEDAALVGATEPIELVDTPIRALDLREEASDLHLDLALDRDVASRARWLERAGGAVLILELESGPSSRDGMATRHSPAPTSGAPPAAPAQSPDRVHSPDLGDPSALHIARSSRDREREARAARRETLAAALDAARRANVEGRLEEADARYAEIALLAPDEPIALAEWSEVLERLGRASEARALLESARTAAPRDVELLVAHARLLERAGDRAGAIELLDRSGLAVTEAPEVHALAAAFLQRAGRHEAAIERYELILRRFPEESRGWLGLGISLEAVGRASEARDVYRIALQVGALPGSTRQWITSRLSSLGEEAR